MSERALELARDLAVRDERIARELAVVARLRSEAGRVEGRARGLAAFAERLPRERERSVEAVLAAKLELAEKERAREEAGHDLAQAEERQNEEAVAAARRALVRTTDAVSSARKQLERLRSQGEALEADARALEREAPELEWEAQRLTGAIRDVPRLAPTAADPGAGLLALVEWGSRARAALLVARSGLENERERLVREANELATIVLGEQTATTVALARDRLERALAKVS